SFPPSMQTAKVLLRRKTKLREHFSVVWKTLGRTDDPPVDYWIEARVLYTFRPLADEFWKAMTDAGVIRSLPPTPTAVWANSTLLADKNNFVKLLNRCLYQLCSSHGMAHRMAFSKEMNCHLFVAEKDTRIGRIKVKAIEQEGTRIVYKA